MIFEVIITRYTPQVQSSIYTYPNQESRQTMKIGLPGMLVMLGLKKLLRFRNLPE